MLISRGYSDRDMECGLEAADGGQSRASPSIEILLKPKKQRQLNSPSLSEK
jgi:hypothetical protein